jgi:hypothetical protein
MPDESKKLFNVIIGTRFTKDSSKLVQDAKLIDLIENLLKRASEGSLVGLAYVAQSEEGFATGWHGRAHGDELALLGTVAVLQARMAKNGEGI